MKSFIYAVGIAAHIVFLSWFGALIKYNVVQAIPVDLISFEAWAIFLTSAFVMIWFWLAIAFKEV